MTTIERFKVGQRYTATRARWRTSGWLFNVYLTQQGTLIEVPFELSPDIVLSGVDELPEIEIVSVSGGANRMVQWSLYRMPENACLQSCVFRHAGKLAPQRVMP